tara:strand:- start:2448 stop:2651 length:204 start_codon:yes stop_codon:yes gene_type:complete
MKKIRFDTVVNVILIPSYKEYEIIDINKLWYSSYYYTIERENALNEMKTYSITNNISLGDAYDQLYK